MKIKVPQVIRIGAYDYRVSYKLNLRVDDGYTGAINHREQVITIEPCYSAMGQNVSLLHEIFHLIDHVYQCHLDEENASRMAGGIAEFLFNNLNIELDWSDIEEDK